MYKSCPLEHYTKIKIRSQKGDVGKTTKKTVNLSVGLLHVGKGVLFVDMEFLTIY
jgi:septum formation inhibitor-activating ATPase MinD